MRDLWLVVYNLLGVPAMWLFFKLYSLFNSKVREGLKERRDLFNELSRSLSAFDNKKTVVIHSSSLGEYQQSIPLMDQLLKKITMFSIHSFPLPAIIIANSQPRMSAKLIFRLIHSEEAKNFSMQ